MKMHPLAKVKGVGKRQHGKEQLSIDEARKLYQHCLREAVTDDGALAVLMALAMGLRASEIVTRTVRDLDDGGRLLRVQPNEALSFAPKTRASKRPAPVPTDLQPLLKARTKDKLPTALLFISEKTGGPHWRDWVAEETRRLCKAAGVQVVCAHALRGVAATSAAEAGIAAEAIARLLGHESSSTTRQSYIAPGITEQQERAQVQRVLAGLPDSAADSQVAGQKA
jgi:integrase